MTCERCSENYVPAEPLRKPLTTSDVVKMPPAVRRKRDSAISARRAKQTSEPATQAEQARLRGWRHAEKPVEIIAW
jgi:hypothetical protein